MDLILLKTFLKVAATGSISKAAAALFVTQSAVSRRIFQLEEHFGRSLLDRSGASLRLTDAGHLLAGRARKMLEMEQELLETLSSRQSRQKISFCCTPSLGVDQLSGALSEFVASHMASVDLNCVFAMPEEALAGLDSDRFDLALIEHCDEIDLTGRTVHHLPDGEVLFVGSPSLGLPEEAGIERFLGERLYLKRENGCATRFLETNLRRIGRSCSDFGSVVYFDDFAFIVRQVREGKGIAYVSTGVVARELEQGLLQSYRVLEFERHRPRTLVLGRNALSRLHHTLITTLYAQFGMEPPEATRKALRP